MRPRSCDLLILGALLTRLSSVALAAQVGTASVPQIPPPDPLQAQVDQHLPHLAQIAPALNDTDADLSSEDSKKLEKAIDDAITERIRHPRPPYETKELVALQTWLKDPEKRERFLTPSFYRSVADSNADHALGVLSLIYDAELEGQANPDDNSMERWVNKITKKVTFDLANCESRSKTSRTACAVVKYAVVATIIGGAVNAVWENISPLLFAPIHNALYYVTTPISTWIDTKTSRVKFLQAWRTKLEQKATATQVDPDNEASAHLSELPGATPEHWVEFYGEVTRLGTLQTNRDYMTIHDDTFGEWGVYANGLAHPVETAVEINSFTTAQASAYTAWNQAAKILTSRFRIAQGDIDRVVKLSDQIFKLRMKMDTDTPEFRKAEAGILAILAKWRDARKASGARPETRAAFDDAINNFFRFTEVQQDAKLGETAATLSRAMWVVLEASHNRGQIDELKDRATTLEEMTSLFTQLRRNKSDLQPLLVRFGIPIDIDAFVATRGKGGITQYGTNAIGKCVENGIAGAAGESAATE